MASIFSASFGLWSSMLKGPRTLPKTFSTSSTIGWYCAGTSVFPVIGAILGMVVAPLLLTSGRLRRAPAPAGEYASGHERAHGGEIRLRLATTMDEDRVFEPETGQPAH